MFLWPIGRTILKDNSPGSVTTGSLLAHWARYFQAPLEKCWPVGALGPGCLCRGTRYRRQIPDHPTQTAISGRREGSVIHAVTRLSGAGQCGIGQAPGFAELLTGCQDHAENSEKRPESVTRTRRRWRIRDVVQPSPAGVADRTEAMRSGEIRLSRFVAQNVCILWKSLLLYISEYPCQRRISRELRKPTIR